MDKETVNQETIDWLLDSDPAIRWQVMRDLTDASSVEVAGERTRVAREGLGATILARQDADGAWRVDGKPAWLSTLFTLQQLRAMGIDPVDQAVVDAMDLAENNLRWSDRPDGWNLRSPEFGGNPFYEGEVEPCISGGVLAFGSYFGHPAEKLARRLLGEQLADGGWNCEAPPSVRSSFHTTICVLEGLLEYERAAGPSPEISEARRRGEEYLLERGLFRRRSTGEVVELKFLELAFPPRYRYDVLRALDFFRAAGREPDVRMREAVAIVAGKQQADGRWLLEQAYDEALLVGFGERVGEACRWITLRALRVLRWFEARNGMRV
ncbi:hypothetical protein ACFPT7_12195 [Acidicapsa dinghuensis]|uniref:Squalene cyclase C-terminal domain-containing protein n=1 Tax=Acidicapsa dinghuensis TaxID=2218256 RepID=A0ABW1EGU7_9BACT|nr:hypothetical protein [Acidicapsa dinghuensis]